VLYRADEVYAEGYSAYTVTWYASGVLLIVVKERE